jgi:hypothetical protein
MRYGGDNEESSSKMKMVAPRATTRARMSGATAAPSHSLAARPPFICLASGSNQK